MSFQILKLSFSIVDELHFSENKQNNIHTYCKDICWIFYVQIKMICYVQMMMM